MAAMDKKQRIDELVVKLNEASKAYYDDAAEIMTNYEYDEMYDELLALEDETGYVRGDSPSRNVGYETKTALPKVTHDRKMLSLNKTKDRDELKAWLGEHEGLLSWKLDGLTVVLTYEGGRLSRAVTRGNGVQGELITDNALACRNVPAKISHTGKTVVRGEAVIKYSDFQKINDAIDDANAKYKNPRNLCSGSIRQLDPKVTAERNVYFYAFTLTSAEGMEFETRSAQMEWMRQQGFDVVDYVKTDASGLVAAIDDYESRIPDFDIPSDGLVLTLEDLAYAATLGETAKFPRDSIAFKWRDQQAETTLLEIEWSPSRTGLLNPVAVFEPVELEGTTVSRASVHNVNIMEDLKLGTGEKIRVYKANMIIPQISENITNNGKTEVPEACPVCGKKTTIKNENGTKTVVCTNPMCFAKLVKKFSLFVSRDAMNIEGISEAGLFKFIRKGILKELPDIFGISKFKDDIIEMEGFGETSYENLIDSINSAKKTTPARLLYGLGVPGVGVATANLIARECRNNWGTMQELNEEDLLQIEGIGAVLSHDYTAYFSNEGNKVMLKTLLECVSLDETFKSSGISLEGKTFVITGSLNNFTRKELKEEIEAEGGKVAGSVSSKTSYLITNDTTSGSSKNKAAKELGVSIIDEEEIMAMLGH